MMSKTHITVGVATALVLTTSSESGMADVLAAVAGGALGGVAADVDILGNDYKKDALTGQGIAVGLVALTLVIDKIAGTGILDTILEKQMSATIGVAIYIVFMVVGFLGDHRSYTHSLVYMLLCTLAIVFIYMPMAAPYLLGYASHLVIDLLNKKGIQLLFPLKFKPCLHLCYANKIGNTVIMFMGLVVIVLVLIAIRIF